VNDIEVTVYVVLPAAWQPEEAVVPLQLIVGNGGRICAINQFPTIRGEVRDFRQPSESKESRFEKEVGQ
jgi:hypothetical protein